MSIKELFAPTEVNEWCDYSAWLEHSLPDVPWTMTVGRWGASRVGRTRWRVQDASAPNPAPSTVAARYLRWIGGDGRGRLVKHRLDWDNLRWRPPLYTHPWRGDGCQIDLDSAYASIFGPVELDMRFNAERGYYARGERPFKGLDALDKPARLAVGGLIRSTARTVWRPREKRMVQQKNYFFTAPDLWAYIMAILNGIMDDISRTVTVHYIATDSVIVNASDVATVEEILAEEWGMTWKIEAEGETEIIKQGCYRVGEKRTAPYEKKLKKYSNPIDTVKHLCYNSCMPPEQIAWLKSIRKESNG